MPKLKSTLRMLGQGFICHAQNVMVGFHAKTMIHTECLEKILTQINCCGGVLCQDYKDLLAYLYVSLYHLHEISVSHKFFPCI